jgi:AcrR family transcriptional regulator
LLAAARTVFSQRGYHDTNITHITEAAGVAVGTFYLHFRDKDEIFNILFEEMLEALRVNVTSEVWQYGPPTLARVVHTILNHAYAERGLVRIGLTGGGQFVRLFQVQDMIAYGLSNILEAQKPLLGEYDGALLARFITGMLIQGIISWFEQDEPSPDEMAEQMLRLLAHGLPIQFFDELSGTAATSPHDPSC